MKILRANELISNLNIMQVAFGTCSKEHAESVIHDLNVAIGVQKPRRFNPKVLPFMGLKAVKKND
jgi:hypothetical protein